MDGQIRCADCGQLFDPQVARDGLCPWCEDKVSGRKVGWAGDAPAMHGTMHPVFTCLFCNAQGKGLAIYRISRGRLGICRECAGLAVAALGEATV